MTTTSARQQQRRRTAAQFTSENPVLAPGEFAVESDTGGFKVGNGSTAWNGLPYQNAQSLPELVADDPSEVDLATAGGVTTLTLTDQVARLADQHRSGQYYYNVLSDSYAAGPALAQSTLYLMPSRFSAGTLNAIGMEVSTAAASSVVRLGVYTDTDGLPDVLIAEATSTADTSTTGAKELTISAALPVNGVYWLGIVCQGAATMAPLTFIRGSELALPLGTGSPSGTTTYRSRSLSGVTGALPSNCTGLSNTPAGPSARIFFRYA